MEKNNETLSILRHSTSHIMAQAVQSLFPSAKLAIGPATADGFYYDFDLTDGHAFTQEDLAKIEEKMKEIIKQNLTFENTSFLMLTNKLKNLKKKAKSTKLSSWKNTETITRLYTSQKIKTETLCSMTFVLVLTFLTHHISKLTLSNC